MKNVLMIRNTSGVSGAENYNLNLINGIFRYKDLFLIYITDYQKFANRIESQGINVEPLKIHIKEVGTKKELLKAIISYPSLIVSYYKVFRNINIKFDIICLQSMTEKIFFSPIWYILGYKVVWIEHGPIFITSRSKIIKFLYKFLQIFNVAIVATSTDIINDLTNGGIHEERIKIISVGINSNHLHKEKKHYNTNFKNLNRSSEIYIIGFSTTFSIEKGIIEFIEVANLVLTKNKNVIFLMVGDGPMYEWAKEKVLELKIEKHFQFVGFQEDVKRYLNIMDIFFFPTNHHEGLSMALLEAASMELLILTHDIGGNREIVIDGETGFLYKNFDAKKLSKKLLDLIKNYKKYNQIRKNARKLVIEKYDISLMAKRYHDLFMSL